MNADEGEGFDPSTPFLSLFLTSPPPSHDPPFSCTCLKLFAKSNSHPGKRFSKYLTVKIIYINSDCDARPETWAPPPPPARVATGSVLSSASFSVRLCPVLPWISFDNAQIQRKTGFSSQPTSTSNISYVFPSVNKSAPVCSCWRYESLTSE